MPKLVIGNQLRDQDKPRPSHPSLLGNCGSCAFYKPFLDPRAPPNSPGSCHRYPPQVSIAMSQNGPVAMSNFPRPSADWVCGEYIARLSLES